MTTSTARQGQPPPSPLAAGLAHLMASAESMGRAAEHLVQAAAREPGSGATAIAARTYRVVDDMQEGLRTATTLTTIAGNLLDGTPITGIVVGQLYTVLELLGRELEALEAARAVAGSIIHPLAYPEEYGAGGQRKGVR
jgi:hypothetical protein